MTSTPVGAGGTTDDVRGARFHDDELTVDATLARRLVRRAFPEHAAHAVRPTGDTGSSNALFRLGDDLVVRLPRQPGGGASIAKEGRWLPSVASRVTVSVPTVVGVGGPALGYPERWAVTGWLEGSRATPPTRPAGSSHGLAADLARFVTEVRAMEVPDCAGTDPDLSWYRGGPLRDLDADFRDAVEACRPLGPDLDLDEALRVWDRAVECSDDTATTRAWFHGDLLAENLLLDDAGRLAAVLDFGGLAVGDPTVDLVVAWEVLDEQGRHELRRALDVDDPAWTASRGWALLIALITVPYYGRTMPRRCSDRMAMARAALAGR